MQRSAKGIELLIPSELSGNWKIVISDVLGNLVDEAEFDALGGSIYRWDLRNVHGSRVASGSYVLIAQYTDQQGRTRLLRRLIGVKE